MPSASNLRASRSVQIEASSATALSMLLRPVLGVQRFAYLGRKAEARHLRLGRLGRLSSLDVCCRSSGSLSKAKAAAKPWQSSKHTEASNCSARRLSRHGHESGKEAWVSAGFFTVAHRYMLGRTLGHHSLRKHTSIPLLARCRARQAVEQRWRLRKPCRPLKPFGSLRL